MTKENKSAQDKAEKRPDYTVRQYRYVQAENGGTKARKETVGVCWLNSENGSITLRLNGKQLIEGDLYLFPKESKDAE